MYLRVFRDPDAMGRLLIVVTLLVFSRASHHELTRLDPDKLHAGRNRACWARLSTGKMRADFAIAVPYRTDRF